MSAPIPELSLNTSSSATASGTAMGANFGDFGLQLQPPKEPGGFVQYVLPGLALAGVAYLIWRGR